MTTKNYSIDALRVIMAVLVIMIHSTLVIYDKKIGIFILVEGFGRIAVPFFFVVSGFYLEQTLQKDKLSSWLSKIVKMYVVWNIIYLPFQIHLIDAIFDRNIEDLNINNLAFDMIFGYWQLWFLPAIIIGALLINACTSFSSRKLLSLVIVTFISATTLWYLAMNKIINMPGFWANPVSLRNGVFLGFPLMAIGYVLAREKQNHVVTNYLASNKSLTLSILFVICEGVFGYYTHKGFYDFTFSSAILSTCLLAFCLKNPKKIELNIDGSSLSTYLYMVHVIFYLIYVRFTQNALILFAAVLASSWLTAHIIMKAKNTK
ncbi:acyltransferase [Yokenella regensburgei]|uniref:acyltransferase family protein n=1 Tax=Yokenella regensburgei TaxID=158877 RepID=UPI0025738457|nr:acyltransferase [Yokenella regensburgei]MDQ4431521.1 acyltransferase [Yokenella regensburgei]